MTTNTMGRDEAVEVLRNLRDSSQRVGSESICPKWASSEFAREVAALDVALAALQAQASTEAWRDLAIANGDIVDEIREIVGLTGKPGNVVEAVRKLVALRDGEAKHPAAVGVDEGGRVVSGQLLHCRVVTRQLLHWSGVPVHVTGTVSTSPGNWSLIDAARAALSKENKA